jgi:hypothetical protein
MNNGFRLKFAFGVSTRFRLKFQPCTYECITFGRQNLKLIQLFHSLRYEKNKNKKSVKFAAHQVNENATFLLGFQQGFV